MYIVAVNTDTKTRYSMTVRDLERSPHWKAVEGNMIRDSRASEYKPFTVLAEFMSESAARKFASVIEAAYAQAGIERETVKPECDCKTVDSWAQVTV